MTQPASVYFGYVAPPGSAQPWVAAPMSVYGGEVVYTRAGDAIVVTDASILKGSNVLNSPSGQWNAAHKGNTILVPGAGAAGADLVTTISAVVRPTQVQLALTASTQIVNGVAAWGIDHGSSIANALGAVSGTGYNVVLPPGNYLIATPIDYLATGITRCGLVGYGATIIAAMPGSGNNMFAGGAKLGNVYTLAANVNGGQNQFQIATGAPLSVGQTIELTAGELGSIYNVTAVSGSSPQTVTVDRVILFTYLLSAGAQVSVVLLNPDRVNFEGITFTGSCEQYIKIREHTHSYIRNCRFVNIVSFASNMAFFVSLYSFDVQLDNLFVNGPNGAGMGSCEQCWALRYTFVGTPNSPFTAQQGFNILNSANSGLREFSINGATGNGVQLDQLASTAGVPFTLGCVVANGVIGNCAGIGIVDNGWYTVMDRLLIENCVGGGINLEASAESPKVSRCRVINNGDLGLTNVSGFATGTPATVIDCYFSQNKADPGSGTTGIFSEGPMIYIENCQIVGTTLTTNSGFGIYVTDQGGTFGTAAVIDGCDILVNGSSLGAGIVTQTGSPRVYITNSRVRFSGGGSFAGSGIDLLAGKMWIDNTQLVQLSGTSGATGFASVAGTTLRLGQACDFDGTTTPFSMGGYCSRSVVGATNAAPVIANGTTAVDVTWPDLKATERVFLSLLTKGGTPAFPQVTYTPGTKFTITSFTGDTSTYHYEVR